MKYKDTRDFVEQNFLVPLTKSLTENENIFKLEEDENNYYINAYLNNEKYHLMTFYKDKVALAIKELEKGNNV